MCKNRDKLLEKVKIKNYVKKIFFALDFYLSTVGSNIVFWLLSDFPLFLFYLCCIDIIISFYHYLDFC